MFSGTICLSFVNISWGFWNCIKMWFPHRDVRLLSKTTPQKLVELTLFEDAYAPQVQCLVDLFSISSAGWFKIIQYIVMIKINEFPCTVMGFEHP